MSNYVIAFDLALLEGPNGEPNVPVATIYNFIATQANVIGHAIRNAKLSDPVPYVDIISDRPETERGKIIEWLDANDLMRPRALRLGQDDIGKDAIMAVFDSDQQRVKNWRAIGIACFQLDSYSDISGSTVCSYRKAL